MFHLNRRKKNYRAMSISGTPIRHIDVRPTRPGSTKETDNAGDGVVKATEDSEE
jgi:hypothetical protein